MVYTTAVLLTAPVWVSRMLRTGKWRTDWPGRFGRCGSPSKDPRQTLLIHAVSVGEVNAIAKLVERLEAQQGDSLRIVISTTTDTGTARARQRFEPAHRVVRYPLDFTACVERFLDGVKPDLVALTELEVWPNFVHQCRRRNVPVCVINGRLSARSYKRYRLISALLRPTFSKLTTVAAQTPAYAKRFVSLGVNPDRVQVLDSMKWDTAGDGVDDAIRRGADALAKAMGIDRTRPVIVAGSTGPDEERLLIDQCPPDAQLVLVPRKPERFDEVAALHPAMIRRSTHPDGAPLPDQAARLYLIDTMGELLKAYALADVAIVGRSLTGKLHGSNPMEPVALGRPTVIGPHYGDFEDIVEALKEADGIVVDPQPGQAAARLLADREGARALAKRGRVVIAARGGSTERHARMILNLLKTKPIVTTNNNAPNGR